MGIKAWKFTSLYIWTCILTIMSGENVAPYYGGNVFSCPVFLVVLIWGQCHFVHLWVNRHRQYQLIQVHSLSTVPAISVIPTPFYLTGQRKVATADVSLKSSVCSRSCRRQQFLSQAAVVKPLCLSYPSLIEMTEESMLPGLWKTLTSSSSICVIWFV